MYPIDVITSLTATNSRRDKEQIILKAFLDGSEQFFTGVRLALDPLITFNVGRVAEVLDDDGAPGDWSFAEFLDLANRLYRRDLRGNAARDAIHDAAERCDVPTWNGFYRRVLLKDLKVGIDEKTVNKVLKSLLPAHSEAQQYLIPVFKCQLAHDGEHADHAKKVHGRKLIDAKLDGVRMLTVLDKDAGVTTLFSRNGLVIDNFPEIQTSLQTLLPRLPGSIVLDGELVSPQGFQHLMSLFRRKDYHADMAVVRYALFDVLPLGDFRNGQCLKPQRERHALLEVLQESGLWADTSGRIRVIPQIEVDLDIPDGQIAFAEFNRQAINDGYEGVMIKDPEAPYTCKRTTAWLKRKPFIEVTLTIAGFEPGDPEGKYKDTLGAVVGRGWDDGKRIESNVSAGLSDAMREEIWQNPHQFRDLLMEVRADCLTLDDGATTYGLRFPRWKGIRGRWPLEKL